MTLKNKIMPDARVGSLKKLLDQGRLVRVIEAHNGLSAIIGNDISVEDGEGNGRGFDALWVSSLTETAAKGHPDVEILGFTSRLNTIHEVAEVSNKPIIVDGDTGMDSNHFEYMVKKMERAGVSAVIIEDKVFPKRNSLDGEAKQTLEDPKTFAAKIRRGREIRINDSFLIIARIESLIAGAGLEDALMRARAYLDAGADGIMIHSKSKDPAEILRFAEEYKKICQELGVKKPLISVPTAYNTITDEELHKRGFNIVIHANHMLRSSCKAMEDVCRMILASGRSMETDPFCAPVKHVFRLVGFEDVKQKDAENEDMLMNKMRVIIPAAGEHPDLEGVLGGRPCCMLDINGKTILERQIEATGKFGLKNVVVIRGHQKGQIRAEGVKFFDNDDYANTSVMASLMKAKEEFGEGFIYVNSDIIFEEEMIKGLMAEDSDIVIIVDGSYRNHKHDVDKRLDLVTLKHSSGGHRNLKRKGNFALRIGKNIPKEMADGEFIGMAKFSREGAANLRKVYEDCMEKHKGRFHEADSVERSGITDMLQELIDRGFKVSVIEVYQGWTEIHNKDDIERARGEVA